VRARSIDEASPLLLGLALMKEGSFLVISQPRSNRFIQFLSEDGDGVRATLLFDLPRSDGNEAVFDAAVSYLRSRSYELHRVDEDQARPLTVVQIRIHGSPDEVAARARDLAEHALAGLGITEGPYEMVLHGEPDIEARARRARPDMEALASMRVPILSWLARRALRKQLPGE
jgi:hypothetical protein